jgi:hypothetical protein
MRDRSNIERVELSDDELETVAAGMLTLGGAVRAVAISDALEQAAHGAISELGGSLIGANNV